SAGKVDVVLACCHRFDDALMKQFATKEGPLRILIDADGSSRLKNAGLTSKSVIVRPPAKGTERLTLDLHLLKDAPARYDVDRYRDALRLKRPLQEEADAAVACNLVDAQSK